MTVWKTSSSKRSRSETSASREWTVRMSARFSSTPSSFRSGFSESRASSTTSIACSTPCRAKYWASAVVGRSKESDRLPCGSRSTASVFRPARRSTSVSVRTVVVLPVPPFWDRTAIVCAIAPDTTLPRSPRDVRWPDRRPGGSSGLPSGVRAARIAGRGADGGARRNVREAQPVAPDDDLVAVLQEPAVDPLAVHEHAVEAAVVEQPHPVGVLDDQRVASRDRRVVEAHVGREAAADPGPLARQGDRVDLVALLVEEVVAGHLDPGARLRQPGAAVGRDRRDQRGMGRVLLYARGDPLGAEQGRPQELLAAAARAGLQRFGAVEGERVPAVLAAERA